MPRILLTARMSTDTIPEHLGGFLSGPHGDEATWYPDLWRWMAESLDIGVMIDIGAGEGHATRWFMEHGIWARPIDGVATEAPGLLLHDYTIGPLTMTAYDNFDLGWACEFVEHLEERFLPNLVSTFQACRYIAMTHAFPGQLGHHHVNCRDPEYWLGFMAGIGFKYEVGLTQQGRAVASFNEHPLNHFVRSGLVFSRR